MGRELARSYAEAARTFHEADRIVQFPLSELAWEGPSERLTLTHNAQPALLVHSVAAFRVVKDALGPVAMGAGHSLGEFSAYVAAGSLSFADALRLVRLRGELMHSAGEARQGTMAAILGLDDDLVSAICRDTSREEDLCVPANYNSPGQVVVSGDPPAVRRVMEAASEAGARKTVPLNVSGAFHSPLMAPARDGLREALESVEFRDPEFPVVSNVTADAVTTGTVARELLAQQLSSPVLWSRSVGTMVSGGASRFLELGSGRVLCGLNRRITEGVVCVSVGEPPDVAAYLASQHTEEEERS